MAMKDPSREHRGAAQPRQTGAEKRPRQVTVQPLEPKQDKGDPRVPPNQENETPRRGGEGQDERSGKNRDGMPRST